jgi:dolichyl-phosphate beta-glucosyltransferase
MQLIVPARNEAHRLPRTLTALRERLAQDRAAGLPTGPVEVLVVDNASTDRTSEVARIANTPELPVRVTRCPRAGKGAAVRHGVGLSTHDVVGFMDADCATDLAALRVAIDLLADGADLAIGSRALDGSRTWARHSKVREHGATLFRSLAGTLVPGVRDTQCGFKLMRGDLAREIFGELRTDGFSFDVELLARALARGHSVAEFPVVWTDMPGSTFVPARHGATAFWELGRIAWHLRRPRPAALPLTTAPLPIHALSMPIPGRASTEPALSLPMVPPLGVEA